MKDKNLTQLIRQYGKEVFIKKGEYLFQEGDDTRIIYLINNGGINLSKDGRVYLKLGVDEIIGEKTFFEQGGKFFAAIADVYSSIVALSFADYQLMTEQDQRFLIENISVFLSNRIYKMNNILSFITEFNARLVEMKGIFDKQFILDFFHEFINFDKYIIVKKDLQDFHILDGDMFLDENIANFINLKSQGEESDFQYIGSNYVLFKSGSFYFLFYGNITVDRYVFKNTLLYSGAMLVLICSYLEENNHNMIMKNIKEDDINIESSEFIL